MFKLKFLNSRFVLIGGILLMNLYLWGQDENCSAIPVSPVAFQTIPVSAFQDGEERMIKIYFHVYRDGNGNNGQTQARLDEILLNLNTSYQPTGILFFYYPCETRWVDDTDLHNSTDECDFFVHNRHLDGVDVHVKGDGTNFIGIAAGIPSDEFLIGGERADGTPAGLSSTAPHEMGHCLGLFHTHHGTCAEAGNDCEGNPGGGENDTDDFVEDTPPDARGTANVICVYQENPVCEPGTFNPLTDNFMSYYRHTCRANFTDGQCARMMELMPPAIIHTSQDPCACEEEPDPCICDENPDPCLCQTDPAIHIQTSTLYATDMNFYGDLIIEDGATLTITSKVTLGPLVTIYVEDNSKLILDGGTLTACGESWQGVKVAGQFGLGAHSPAGSSNLKRGYVELKNGAVIEKANVGIDGRDLFVDGGDIPSGLHFYHGGGKITISSGSTIQDCGIGVRLHRYGWGAVIGAGPIAGNPIGSVYETSAFSNSFFKNCEVAAIYSDQNIGLSLINNEFGGNYSDYEGYLSSITAIDNDFTSFLFIASEHPVIPGSNFTNNTFTNNLVGIDGQGNIKRHIFKQNTANASSLWLTGELLYGVSENAFSNSGYVGLFTESTGENIYNWTLDNTFSGQKYAISVFGENDTEYLANCFSNTTYADLEINSGASIYLTQGSQQASAGNCFNFGARIKTGNGISPFDYWTKDGFDPQCHPISNCKYPGGCNGFSISESDEESEVDCETNIIGDPPSELNCECGSGLTGCTDAIASIRTTIAGFGGSTGDDILIAQYSRCLDSLIRTYIDTTLASGQVEDCIDFLSVQPEFRYRAMAYGIIIHNLEYTRVSDFLDTLETSKTEEQDFVNVQKIWLNYLMSIDTFKLSAADSITIRTAGEAYNPLAGYARTVFYKLTGERITRDFIHTDSTVIPRNSDVTTSVDTQISVEFHVWPNPVTGQDVEISFEGANPEKEYVLVVYDALGVLRSATTVSNEVIYVPIGDATGIYFVCLFQDGERIHTKKVVRI